MKRRKFLKNASVAGGATAVAASTFPAPAIAQSRVEITMVATWGRDFPGLGTGAQNFAKSLTDISDGRIQVTYYAGGERVKPLDVFDEVASGNSQMYHSAEYYWNGKHPGFNYFAAVPFGMVFSEINSWMNFGGGQELLDELGEQYNIKAMPCGNSGVQMGGWFRKEMNSPDDFKGLKMRMPGLGGDVIAKLGASPVGLPGGQIYENLISGAIDATEWVGPWNDEAYKFYEAAKYYYYPGMHEPATMLSLGINRSWWENLRKSDQMLISAAAHNANDLIMSEFNAKNGAALDRLVNNQGVILKRFTEDIFDSFGDAAEEVFDEKRQHSDLANRIHESFVESRKNVGSWMNISDQEYLRQRNRVLGV